MNENAEVCVGLTGTLVQNELGDLWAILNMIEPGFLGDKKSFEVRDRVILRRISAIPGSHHPHQYNTCLRSPLPVSAHKRRLLCASCPVFSVFLHVRSNQPDITQFYAPSSPGPPSPVPFSHGCFFPRLPLPGRLILPTSIYVALNYRSARPAGRSTSRPRFCAADSWGPRGRRASWGRSG